MIEYKAVPSGLELSRRIADCLEAAAPQGYAPNERPSAIRSLNDILQGRSVRSADELLAELEKYGDGKLLSACEDVRAFLRQKGLLTTPYDKGCGWKYYKFEQRKGIGDRALKVVTQALYDQAAKDGFPPEFFRESYFDGVTFYCLPKFADFLGAELHNCKFAVCGLTSTSLILANIYDTEFYSSVLNFVDLCSSTLVRVRFQDCELSNVLLQKAQLKHCGTIDCSMDGVDYAGATLDGCSFDRITAGRIRMDWTTITQGGATEEECRQNRKAIYEALGIKGEAA